MSRRLIIFAKAPSVGEVKTRLIPSLGAEAACMAYGRLLQVLVTNFSEMTGVTVCFSPADAEAELRPLFPSTWRFTAQQGAGLGERLSDAFSDAFTQSKKVAIIGSDCPDVQPSDVEAAFENLDTHDLVLGPALDGGYWLVALNAPAPPLFEGIAWGTSTVLEQTITRARDLNLRVKLLRTLRDIDTPEDWDDFCRRIKP